jgi:hypothetical protein
VSEKKSAGAAGRALTILALLITLLISAGLPARAQLRAAAPPPRVTTPAPVQTFNPNMLQNFNPGMMSNPAPTPNLNPSMVPNPGGGGVPQAPNGGTPSRGRALLPSFIGLNRSQAITLAQQYDLAPAFDGSTSNDALVARQAPEPGVLIFRTAMPVRFQMRAPAAPTPAPQPTPAAAAPTPAPTEPTAAPTTPAPPAAEPTPATPAAAPARPVQPITPVPVPTSDNWWILLAIAVGLAGVASALLGRRPDIPPRIVPRFNELQTGSMAQLATQTLSTGLAGATVSIQAAGTRRFQLRYVLERNAQPVGVAISVEGGPDGR